MNSIFHNPIPFALKNLFPESRAIMAEYLLNPVLD
jgi:hypothetical protein